MHATGGRASGPVLPTAENGGHIVRVDLKALQNGVLAENAALRDGDTIFVPRAESVYVFGQVKNPGAYALQQKDTSVLQALSLGTRNALFWFHAGMIRLGLGDRDGARQDLARALDTNPAFSIRYSVEAAQALRSLWGRA